MFVFFCFEGVGWMGWDWIGLGGFWRGCFFGFARYGGIFLYFVFSFFSLVFMKKDAWANETIDAELRGAFADPFIQP